VLLKDLLVLLQMQDDNRLVLKCQETQTIVGKEDVRSILSPVLRVGGLLARAVATGRYLFMMSLIIFNYKCFAMLRKCYCFPGLLYSIALTGRPCASVRFDLSTSSY